MHLVKLLNTETAKIKDWVTIFYGLKYTYGLILW